MKRQGFTLMELLVSMVLLSMAILLLFQGAIALTETMSAGRRQSAMDRALRSALIVLREDLEQMLVSPEMFLEIYHLPDRPLRFRRLRQQASPVSDQEWVEYRLVDHPSQPGLRQLYRHALPMDSVSDSSDLDGAGELLVDALIDFQLWTRSDADDPAPVLKTETGLFAGPPLSVDLLVALTQEPFPFVANPLEGTLSKTAQFQGVWERIRVQPILHWVPQP